MASAQQAAEIKVTKIRKKQETDNLVRALLDMGEAMIGSGAEIYRAEDTLRRIAKAYGASDCEVFIITSSIVITLELPQEHPRTRTRRIRKPVENDFTKLEDLNELSREVCVRPIPAQQLRQRTSAIAGTGAQRRGQFLGYILASAAFCLFFTGNLLDALAAGVVGAFLFWMQICVGPFCMNSVVLQFLCSFFSGIMICILHGVFPSLQMAKIMIGDIMLLIPGASFTNSIRDVLLGDTLSGIVRFVEALLLAAVLTVGFLAAILLFGRVF